MQKNWRFILKKIIISLVILLNSSSILALSCRNLDFEGKVSGASTVFIGTVVNIQHYQYKIKIIKVLKGTVDKKVFWVGRSRYRNSGLRERTGLTYIFFGTTWLCNGPILISKRSL